MNIRTPQLRSILQLSGLTLGALVVAYGVTQAVRRQSRPRLGAPSPAFSGTRLGRPVTRLGHQLLSRLPLNLLPRRCYLVKRSITVNRTPEEVYAFWRNFENLPRFMDHLESVTVQDDTQSHWVARAPAGMSVEWDAEIVNDRADEFIEWRSVNRRGAHNGNRIINAGIVSFTPAFIGRGAEVSVILQYEQPGGRLGALVARAMGEHPEDQIREDLRRFKQLLEAGEIPTGKNRLPGKKEADYVRS